jgi:hypothetical protein
MAQILRMHFSRMFLDLKAVLQNFLGSCTKVGRDINARSRGGAVVAAAAS